jgi:hypothetical protein
MNQLDALKSMTTVVADTGDFLQLAQFRPQDATTNPSLILKAVQKPDYAPLLQQTMAEHGKADLALAMDHLLVRFGVEILKHVPGRVSTEVDARLSFDTAATLMRARRIMALYAAQGIGHERVLIKIAATWEGIQAAAELEREMDIFFKKLFEDNRDMNEYLFEYVLPDNTKELIKVMPDYLNHNDIGIYLSDADQDKLYIDYMLQNLQPISQNAGQGADTISTILKAIASGASASEIDKMIRAEADTQRKRMEEQQQSQQQLQAQMRQMEMEMLKYQSDLRKEEAISEQQARQKTMEQNAEIEMMKFARQSDINENKINDRIEAIDKEWEYKKPIEEEKIKSMFKEFGGIKNAKKYVKQKNKIR